MANSKPVVLLSEETTAQQQENDGLPSCSVPTENPNDQDAEAMVRLFNRKKHEDELRRQIYAELSKEDKKFISIEEIVFLDDSMILEDEDDEDGKTEQSYGIGVQSRPNYEASYILKYSNEQPVIYEKTSHQ